MTMFHPTLKQLAVLLFAGTVLSTTTAKRVVAGDWVPVSADQVYGDYCDEPRPGCCDSLKRKLALHCVYTRRAFTCRYISLPYTQPSSIMYYSPSAAAAGYGSQCPPGSGPMGGYANGLGYGSPVSGPAPSYASPGTVYIR
jgi:hypothetical protein